MEIILKQDVNKVGHKNDIVKVKTGYARNFLIPQGKAIVATESARKVLAEVIRQQSHKAAKALEAAQGIVDALNKLTVKIGAKAGETGKIFGSVNNIQLAEAIQAAGYDIERKQITLSDEAIKELGSYEAKVKVYKDSVATVKFDVVAE
ncbi:MAG TPA: 50S ribosomal protein L9 [Flavobacteriales bacterium]|jgi:large subunit ribosomal protein L9|nr:50S ribosomal protein L9 [Flavobacteriales bacterium]HIB77245.1 50S ribosomal protein L9 [Flavobacteriales bacterium]HIN41824.1 50S ribosomal protein L9 [Flavobacteriales bacterium]HIO16415.1 50S ribosomal protein L9 [Flavobacteriales bacterium]HIO59823.1 50S ribosomal protein L9 [Flavobacteriales bacterium]